MSHKTKDAIVLVARLLVGGIFIGAGWMKLSGMEMTIGYFSQMGLPAAFAYLISIAELAGGIAVVLGLWLELATIGLSIIMIGATYYGVKLAPSMNVPVFQAVMPTLGLLGALLALMSSGAGRIALRSKHRHSVVA